MNLTKYELLLNRHLNLLLALQQKGVTATHKEHDRWDINFVFTDDATFGRYFATLETKKFTCEEVMRAFNVPSLAGECFQKNWKIGARIDGDTLHANIQGTDYTVEYGDLQHHLLEALCSAIVAAPAKA